MNVDEWGDFVCQSLRDEYHVPKDAYGWRIKIPVALADELLRAGELEGLVGADRQCICVAPTNVLNEYIHAITVEGYSELPVDFEFRPPMRYGKDHNLYLPKSLIFRTKMDTVKTFLIKKGGAFRAKDVIATVIHKCFHWIEIWDRERYYALIDKGLTNPVQ